MRGISSLAAPPDLEHGVAPLGPPAPKQEALLGRGVAPPGHRPDLGGGNSFQPLPLTSDGGVAPLGRSCADAAWHSQSLPLIFGEG